MSYAEAYPVEALFADAASKEQGRVRFHRGGGELVLADGRKRDYPYAHAQLAWGGLKDDLPLLTLAGAEGEVVRLYFTDRKVFDAPPDVWPEPLRERARTLTRGRGRAWLALPATAAVLAGLWFSGGYVVSGLANLVPPSVETKMGKVFADATVAGKVSDDPVLKAAVETLGKALVAQVPENPYPFRFRVVEMPLENAFAFPGGEVVVTTGLLAKASSADELAGVVGHEVEHVLHRHTTRRIMQELGLVVGLSLVLGDVGTLGGIAVTYGKDLVGLAFGRDQELESDRDGMRLAHAAGFDPKGLGAFFKRLEAEDGSEIPAILSTHPAHADRLAQIDRLAAELGPPKAGVRPKLPDWVDVRLRARKASGG
jgi:Zn-dependent protease with chaperone function